MIFLKKEIFGPALKALRRRKRINQQELADNLGVTGATISRWEKSITLPDDDAVQKICEFFHVPESFFDSPITQEARPFDLSERYASVVSHADEVKSEDGMARALTYFVHETERLKTELNEYKSIPPSILSMLQKIDWRDPGTTLAVTTALEACLDAELVGDLRNLKGKRKA